MSTDFQAIARRKRGIVASAAPAIISEWGPRLLLLVGSVARGYADEGSDIDLLVVDSTPPAPRGSVRVFEAKGEPIKLEFHSLDDLRGSPGQGSANAARELNRLRDAVVLHDPGTTWPSLRPTLADVRRAFGPPELPIISIEKLLSTAETSFRLGCPDDVVLRSCMAAESLAVVLLSIGEVPVAYTKPKWVWFAIRSVGDEALTGLFEMATLGDLTRECGAAVAGLAHRWCQDVHDLIPAGRLSEDRGLRRLLWLSDKHLRDTISLFEAGHPVAMRSPSLMLVSFGLAALARANSWEYENLSDALVLGRRLGPRIEEELTGLLFPQGVPNRIETARRYNSAVGFYRSVLARVDVQEPYDI